MISEYARIYLQNLPVDAEIADFAIVYSGVDLGENVKIGEHAVIGRTPKATTAMIRPISHSGSTKIGKNCSISAHVIIYAGATIGNECLLGDGCSILFDVTVGERVLISRYVTINSHVKIGNNTRIMDNTHITGQSNIGNFVFISTGVSSANDQMFAKGGRSDDLCGIEIGDYASIGAGAILLPGCKIGKGSIVAAGAVVKGEVPENVLVSGNPAKKMCRVPKFMSRLPD